jgi:DnaJ-class molecular chaperone
MNECRLCHGTGKITAWFGTKSVRRRMELRVLPCHECAGTGLLSEQRLRNGSMKIEKAVDDAWERNRA